MSIPFTFRVKGGRGEGGRRLYLIFLDHLLFFFTSSISGPLYLAFSFRKKVTTCSTCHFYLDIQYGSPQLAEGKKQELFIWSDKCFHSPYFQ